MLAIILFILKLLSILILVVLGLVLLVLCLVLFAPVKYSSKGNKYGEELRIQALVTYLNPIVRVKVHYPDETIVQVKILGITVYPRKLKETNASQKKKTEQTSPQSGGSHTTEAYQTQGDAIPKRQEEAEPEKKDTAQSAQESSTLDTVRTYISLFQENKGLILEVLKVTLKALKTILPRKCYIKAVFGTGQADTTGFIYAAYCSLQDYLPGEIILEPVWTEAHVEGEYYLKGKIRLIHFVAAAIRIIANRNVRLLIKKIRSVM